MMSTITRPCPDLPASDKAGIGHPHPKPRPCSDLPASDKAGIGHPHPEPSEVDQGAMPEVRGVFDHVGCLEHIRVPEDVASCCHRLPSFAEDVGQRIPEADVELVW